MLVGLNYGLNRYAHIYACTGHCNNVISKWNFSNANETNILERIFMSDRIIEKYITVDFIH